MAEAPQRTEREERVDRLLLLAERLRQRDRPSRGRTLLDGEQAAGAPRAGATGHLAQARGLLSGGGAAVPVLHEGA